MSVRNYRTSLVVLVFVILALIDRPVTGVDSRLNKTNLSNSPEIEFALTGGATGWLRSGNRVFRTVNNAVDWQDVTPVLNQNESLLDIYLLNSNDARMLVVSKNGEEWQLDLRKTTNAGATWQTQPITLSSQSRDFGDVPFGSAYMQWQDNDKGWILIKQATSSNFSLGVLLKTSDGGLSWQVLEPPAAEEFVFLNENVGYMRDPVDPTRLYQTQDGGKSWQGFQPLMTQSVADGLQLVGLPIKWQGGEILLPAWINGGGTEPDLVFLRSKNVLPSQTAEMVWEEEPGAINSQSWRESFGSNLAFAQLSSFDGENIWVGLTNGSCKQDLLQDNADLSMSTLTCENKYLLLSSQDGGEHWAAGNIPFDAVAEIEINIQEETFQKITDDEQQNNAIQSVQSFIGHGFDTCEIPSLSKLQAWYNNSPYKAVNLYIGGVSRACDNTELTAAYVQQMYNQGWRFIPTWVGPQAPDYYCTTGYKNTFSIDPATAYTQGVDNANQAAAKLLELGLTNPDGTGSVVYYDLENFYYSSACSAAARNFVQGWTNRLQTLGIYSGLYASSRNLNDNKIYNLQPPPSVVWIAEWFIEYYFRPNVTVFDVDYLADNYWSNHQRVYQYSGDHYETWGGVTIKIDNDVLDGVVAVPSDFTPPVTSYTESGTIGISPWYKTAVTVTLTAMDNSVGVKKTYYRVNAGSWQEYSGPFAVSGSGEMTIDYRSVDFNDNWEVMKSASFYVDNQPPVNPVVTSSGCQSWNGVPQAYCNNPWFTWAGAYDLGIGLNPVDTYEFYWGTNENATSGTRTASTQFNPPAIPTGGPYYLRIRTQDRHGLWSAWETIYTLIYDYRFTHQLWLPRVAK